MMFKEGDTVRVKFNGSKERSKHKWFVIFTAYSTIGHLYSEIKVSLIPWGVLGKEFKAFGTDDDVETFLERNNYLIENLIPVNGKDIYHVYSTRMLLVEKL